MNDQRIRCFSIATRETTKTVPTKEAAEACKAEAAPLSMATAGAGAGTIGVSCAVTILIATSTRNNNNNKDFKCVIFYFLRLEFSQVLLLLKKMPIWGYVYIEVLEEERCPTDEDNPKGGSQPKVRTMG